ncbi:MAG: hypothetical protein ACRDDZ_05605 [Marinifilaceae bacterium]
MNIVFLVILLIIGVVLVVAAILYLPAITVAGFFGLICLMGGIGMSYFMYGMWAGHSVTIGVILLISMVFLWFIRNKTFKRITGNNMLKDVVEGVDSSIHKGDVGVTLGNLSPVGKVLINDKIVEGESEMGFIGEDKQVIVLRILTNKVIVKLKTELDAGK